MSGVLFVAGGLAICATVVAIAAVALDRWGK